jgi:hypothetical protein
VLLLGRAARSTQDAAQHTTNCENEKRKRKHALRTCFVLCGTGCVSLYRRLSLITRCLCHLDIRYQAVLSAIDMTMTSDADEPEPDEQHHPHHHAIDTTSKQPPHRCTTKWTDATATTTAGNWAFLSLRPVSA